MQFSNVDSHPDFVVMEEKRLLHWYNEGIVEAYLHKNDKSKKQFSFLDGPITANNPMGVHHGRGRTYKDVWQRYHAMRGERGRFRNGFDCQGLWVEVEVEKELGFHNKKDIIEYGVEKFVQKCKDRVMKYSAIQIEQSKRLGMFLDWNNSYFTMSDENNYAIWNFLKVCHERGWMYKGHESVPWCPRCETAISQHEMLTEDYKELVHQSVYLELPIVGRNNEYLLIWTTTPWTIPANIAVAVDKKLEYSLIEGTTGDLFWVAKDLVQAVFGINFKRTVKTVKGSELVGLKYRGPFDHLPAVTDVAKQYPDKFHIVVATDERILPITTTEGTGLVHTAVSAGVEDFKLGKKLGLPMIPVIADNADYLCGFGELSGKNAKKHPELILDLLKQKGRDGKDWVFKIENYKHRYPACWRCKTELVWKVTDEWYIAMDRPSSVSRRTSDGKSTLRQQMIEVAKTINWIPKFGLERELDWLKNMHDWLISKKNRFWGLALPIWECVECETFDVIGGKQELKKKSVSGWDKFDGHTPHKPWIDEVKIACLKCGKPMSRIEPVGNPWLDAGIVPFSTMPKEWFPADFITESFPGQFKNWFYSLIVMSTVLAKKRPFKTVLGFESVVGEDGRPMHKSWGNAIEFNEGAGKIGVDVMRWMYAKALPTYVLPFGYKVAEEIRRRFLLILWNSYRFFVSQALADNWKPPVNFKFQSASWRTSFKLPSALDRWIMARLKETTLTVTASLDAFQSAQATEALETFVNDFSTWYIRRSRERVGPSAKDQADKNESYRTMYRVLIELSQLLAPFMPYVSDEIYVNLTGEKSVHLFSYPMCEKLTPIEKKLLLQMATVRDIATEVHAQRKLANMKVRQPLASVEVAGVKKIDKELEQLLLTEVNVKALHIQKETGELSVSLDTNLSPELLDEGKSREIIRLIQQLRKDAGLQLADKIVAGLSEWPILFEEEIKKATLADSLEQSVSPFVRKV